jgi:hypothetical protein
MDEIQCTHSWARNCLRCAFDNTTFCYSFRNLHKIPHPNCIMYLLHIPKCLKKLNYCKDGIYARSLIADIFRPIMSSRLCASTCIWLGTAPRHSSHNKYNLMSVHFCYLGELYSSMLICLATCQSMLTSLGTFKRVRLKGRISFTQIRAQVEGECCLWTVGGWV